MDPPPVERIRRVQLESHVLLKVITHTESVLPIMGTGQLLGIDLGDTLYITGSFPFMPRNDDVSTARTPKEKEAKLLEQEMEERDYQHDMMRQLREVNVDSCTVGWYISAWMEQFLIPSVIETQFGYQKDLGDNCVALIYDPLKTTNGKVWLKAFRLNNMFMEAYKVGDFTQEAIREKRLTTKDILEEIPIEVHSNPLADIFIGELSQCKELFNQTGADEGVHLEASGYLSQSLTGLVDGTEDLQQAMQRYYYDQKRWKQAELYGGADPKPQKPSKLESMLIARQLAQHCDHVTEVTMDNFENLFFAESLQKVWANLKADPHTFD